MNLASVAQAAETFFLGYFCVMVAGNLVLLCLASRALEWARPGHLAEEFQARHPGALPMVTIVVPAYNEASSLVDVVGCLRTLVYPRLEIIVVNDGSNDDTVARMVDAFGLQREDLSPEAPPLPCAAQVAAYRSEGGVPLRLIDKRNGGKADAINCGIGHARGELFCVIDADSVIERLALMEMVQAFVREPTMVAVGGSVRVANGSLFDRGLMATPAVARHPLVVLQVLEYTRAFLIGRLGWSSAGALMIISGAFGMFRRDAVLSVGGFLRSSIGEDMELVLRLHRRLTERGTPYRMAYLPRPVCWTIVPTSLSVLRQQRRRWQRGLLESLSMNLGLAFSRRSPVCGWVALPWFVVFEAAAPVIELVGYVGWSAAVIADPGQGPAALRYFVLAASAGFLVSAACVCVDCLSHWQYRRASDVLVVLLAAAAESLGYRQIELSYRLEGTVLWLLRRKASWGGGRRAAVFNGGRGGA